MNNNTIDISTLRRDKKFKNELDKIKEEPTVKMLGETVPNYAVYPSDAEDEMTIAARYHPFDGYLLDIKAEDRDELLELIHVVEDWKRSKREEKNHVRGYAQRITESH